MQKSTVENLDSTNSINAVGGIAEGLRRGKED